MRGWIIGCGVVLLIVVGIGLFFGNIVLRQFKEATGKVDEVTVDYQRLENDFPHEVTRGRNLTAEEVERFVNCRREVLADMKSLFLVLEDEELSGFEKMTRSLDIIPSLAVTHARALEEYAMGPSEYLWILNQVMLVFKYAEAEDASAELKSLSRILERPEKSQAEFGPLYTPTYFPDSPEQVKADLLPQIEPWQINLSAENVEAVLANRAGLEETVLIFFCFDHYFKTTYSQLLHAVPAQDLTPEEPQ